MRAPAMPSRDAAEAIGLAGLAFLAQDPTRLVRFLELTGLSVDKLHKEAKSPAMLSAVLAHLLGDESLLMVFAAEMRIAAETIAPAEAVLTAAASGAKR